MNAPRLRGIEVANGRTGVFYSPEDLSVGLVGMTIDGIYGYDPEDATDLVQNVVMLAMGGAPPRIAAAPPATPAEPAKPTGAADKKNKPKEEKKSEEKSKTAKK
jgi:hypothetical protein